MLEFKASLWASSRRFDGSSFEVKGILSRLGQGARGLGRAIGSAGHAVGEIGEAAGDVRRARAKLRGTAPRIGRGRRVGRALASPGTGLMRNADNVVVVAAGYQVRGPKGIVRGGQIAPMDPRTGLHITPYRVRGVAGAIRRRGAQALQQAVDLDQTGGRVGTAARLADMMADPTGGVMPWSPEMLVDMRQDVARVGQGIRRAILGMAPLEEDVDAPDVMLDEHGHPAPPGLDMPKDVVPEVPADLTPEKVDALPPRERRLARIAAALGRVDWKDVADRVGVVLYPVYRVFAGDDLAWLNDYPNEEIQRILHGGKLPKAPRVPKAPKPKGTGDEVRGVGEPIPSVRVNDWAERITAGQRVGLKNEKKLVEALLRWAYRDGDESYEEEVREQLHDGRLGGASREAIAAFASLDDLISAMVRQLDDKKRMSNEKQNQWRRALNNLRFIRDIRLYARTHSEEEHDFWMGLLREQGKTGVPVTGVREIIRRANPLVDDVPYVPDEPGDVAPGVVPKDEVVPEDVLPRPPSVLPKESEVPEAPEPEAPTPEVLRPAPKTPETPKVPEAAKPEILASGLKVGDQVEGHNVRLNHLPAPLNVDGKLMIEIGPGKVYYVEKDTVGKPCYDMREGLLLAQSATDPDSRYLFFGHLNDKSHVVWTVIQKFDSEDDARRMWAANPNKRGVGRVALRQDIMARIAEDWRKAEEAAEEARAEAAEKEPPVVSEVKPKRPSGPAPVPRSPAPSKLTPSKKPQQPETLPQGPLEKPWDEGKRPFVPDGLEGRYHWEEVDEGEGQFWRLTPTEASETPEAAEEATDWPSAPDNPDWVKYVLKNEPDFEPKKPPTGQNAEDGRWVPVPEDDSAPARFFWVRWSKEEASGEPSRRAPTPTEAEVTAAVPPISVEQLNALLEENPEKFALLQLELTNRERQLIRLLGKPATDKAKEVQKRELREVSAQLAAFEDLETFRLERDLPTSQSIIGQRHYDIEKWGGKYEPSRVPLIPPEGVREFKFRNLSGFSRAIERPGRRDEWVNTPPLRVIPKSHRNTADLSTFKTVYVRDRTETTSEMGYSEERARETYVGAVWQDEDKMWHNDRMPNVRFANKKEAAEALVIGLPEREQTDLWPIPDFGLIPIMGEDFEILSDNPVALEQAIGDLENLIRRDEWFVADSFAALQAILDDKQIEQLAQGRRRRAEERLDTLRQLLENARRRGIASPGERVDLDAKEMGELEEIMETDKPVPMDWRPRRLTPSLISALEQCAHKFRRSHIFKRFGETRESAGVSSLDKRASAWGINGTFFHAIMDDLLLLSPEERTLETALRLIVQKWKNRRSEPWWQAGFEKVQGYADAWYINRTNEAMRGFYAEGEKAGSGPRNLPASEDLGRELFMVGVINGIEMEGTVDLIYIKDGKIHIVDYKTTGGRGDRKYDRQVRIYAMLAQQKIERGEAGDRFLSHKGKKLPIGGLDIYYVGGPAPEEIEEARQQGRKISPRKAAKRASVSFTPRDEAALEVEVKKWWDEMQKRCDDGRFETKTDFFFCKNLCGLCSTKDGGDGSCPAWGGAGRAPLKIELPTDFEKAGPQVDQDELEGNPGLQKVAARIVHARREEVLSILENVEEFGPIPRGEIYGRLSELEERVASIPSGRRREIRRAIFDARVFSQNLSDLMGTRGKDIIWQLSGMGDGENGAEMAPRNLYVAQRNLLMGSGPETVGSPIERPSAVKKARKIVSWWDRRAADFFTRKPALHSTFEVILENGERKRYYLVSAVSGSQGRYPGWWVTAIPDTANYDDERPTFFVGDGDSVFIPKGVSKVIPSALLKKVQRKRPEKKKKGRRLEDRVGRVRAKIVVEVTPEGRRAVGPNTEPGVDLMVGWENQLVSYIIERDPTPKQALGRDRPLRYVMGVAYGKDAEEARKNAAEQAEQYLLLPGTESPEPPLSLDAALAIAQATRTRALRVLRAMEDVYTPEIRKKMEAEINAAFDREISRAEEMIHAFRAKVRQNAEGTNARELVDLLRDGIENGEEEIGGDGVARIRVFDNAMVEVEEVREGAWDAVRTPKLPRGERPVPGIPAGVWWDPLTRKDLDEGQIDPKKQKLDFYYRLNRAIRAMEGNDSYTIETVVRRPDGKTYQLRHRVNADSEEDAFEQVLGKITLKEGESVVSQKARQVDRGPRVRFGDRLPREHAKVPLHIQEYLLGLTPRLHGEKPSPIDEMRAFMGKTGLIPKWLRETDFRLGNWAWRRPIPRSMGYDPLKLGDLPEAQKKWQALSQGLLTYLWAAQDRLAEITGGRFTLPGSRVSKAEAIRFLTEFFPEEKGKLLPETEEDYERVRAKLVEFLNDAREAKFARLPIIEEYVAEWLVNANPGLEMLRQLVADDLVASASPDDTELASEKRAKLIAALRNNPDFLVPESGDMEFTRGWRNRKGDSLRRDFLENPQNLYGAVRRWLHGPEDARKYWLTKITSPEIRSYLAPKDMLEYDAALAAMDNLVKSLALEIKVQTSENRAAKEDLDFDPKTLAEMEEKLGEMKLRLNKMEGMKKMWAAYSMPGGGSAGRVRFDVEGKPVRQGGTIASQLEFERVPVDVGELEELAVLVSDIIALRVAMQRGNVNDAVNSIDRTVAGGIVKEVEPTVEVPELTRDVADYWTRTGRPSVLASIKPQFDEKKIDGMVVWAQKRQGEVKEYWGKRLGGTFEVAPKNRGEYEHTLGAISQFVEQARANTLLTPDELRDIVRAAEAWALYARYRPVEEYTGDPDGFIMGLKEFREGLIRSVLSRGVGWRGDDPVNWEEGRSALPAANPAANTLSRYFASIRSAHPDWLPDVFKLYGEGRLPEMFERLGRGEEGRPDVRHLSSEQSRHLFDDVELDKNEGTIPGSRSRLGELYVSTGYIEAERRKKRNKQDDFLDDWTPMGEIDAAAFEAKLKNAGQGQVTYNEFLEALQAERDNGRNALVELLFGGETGREAQRRLEEHGIIFEFPEGSVAVSDEELKKQASSVINSLMEQLGKAFDLERPQKGPLKRVPRPEKWRDVAGETPVREIPDYASPDAPVDERAEFVYEFIKPLVEALLTWDTLNGDSLLEGFRKLPRPRRDELLHRYRLGLAEGQGAVVDLSPSPRRGAIDLSRLPENVVDRFRRVLFLKRNGREDVDGVFPRWARRIGVPVSEVENPLFRQRIDAYLSDLNEHKFSPIFRQKLEEDRALWILLIGLTEDDDKSLSDVINRMTPEQHQALLGVDTADLPRFGLPDPDQAPLLGGGTYEPVPIGKIAVPELGQWKELGVRWNPKDTTPKGYKERLGMVLLNDREEVLIVKREGGWGLPTRTAEDGKDVDVARSAAADVGYKVDSPVDYLSDVGDSAYFRPFDNPAAKTRSGFYIGTTSTQEVAAGSAWVPLRDILASDSEHRIVDEAEQSVLMAAQDWHERVSRRWQEGEFEQWSPVAERMGNRPDMDVDNPWLPSEERRGPEGPVPENAVSGLARPMTEQDAKRIRLIDENMRDVKYDPEYQEAAKALPEIRAAGAAVLAEIEKAVPAEEASKIEEEQVSPQTEQIMRLNLEWAGTASKLREIESRIRKGERGLEQQKRKVRQHAQQLAAEVDRLLEERRTAQGELSEAIEKIRAEGRTAVQNVLANLLKKHRKTGGVAIKVDGEEEDVARFNRVLSELFPQEWAEALLARFDGFDIAAVTERGHFEVDGRQGLLYVPRRDGPVLHELVHPLELAMPQLVALQRAYILSRIHPNEIPLRLADAMPNKGYGESEVFYPDDLKELALYLFRAYPDLNNFEVVSTVLGWLFGSESAIIFQNGKFNPDNPYVNREDLEFVLGIWFGFLAKR